MRLRLLLLPICTLISVPLLSSPAQSEGVPFGAQQAAAAMSMSANASPADAGAATPGATSKPSIRYMGSREAGFEAPALEKDAAAAPAAKTTFQNYVEVATGKQLEVFGRDLFRNVPSTFAPLQSVQVNPDYVVGPGDSLQLRGWGMIDIEANVTVSRNGEVYIPKVGSVKVSGVRYRDLQPYLKKAIGRTFTNFDLSVSLSQTRSVQVYVVGNAQRPGSYTLSAMSTLLNALFVSGGPSATGSLRNIKVRRGSQVINFDLYDILIRGDKSSDVDLRDGDVIYISEVGPQVALFGNVKKPAIFELRQESSLAELIAWAGGFETTAAFKNIIVEKNIDSCFQTVAELQADRTSVKDKLVTVPVRPTDIIRVIVPGSSPIEVKVERQFVRIDGAVGKSGVYELQKGETLKGLVARAGGVPENAYVFGTKLNRESVRRSQEEKIRESVDRFEKEIETNAKQRLTGSTDAAETAAIAGELEAQRRIVQKLRTVRAEGRIILDLRNADATVADLPDFPLLDGDVVYIPQKPTTVDVIGAVYQQNTFMWQKDCRVTEYVSMAGGVSQTGDGGQLYRICANGTVLSRRQSGGNGVVNPGDAIIVPEKLQAGKTFMQNLKDFTTILYQFGMGAAGLAVLKNL
ncbi:MAG: capsule biosynthesis protein [Chlorobiaceae bacterium]|nr:capsule biosynthesis protein [Chlorobiaceae bacterium]